MKRHFFAVLFVLIVLVLTSASCKLGVSASTSGQRNEEQTEPESNPDLLSGVFTVNSSGKKVQFSTGALYWDGSAFKMEENQYDYRTWHNSPSVINGEYNTNNIDIAEGATGLFYWSKDKEKTYAQTYDSLESTSDTFALANGGAIEGWDVLSKEEWNYLINREDSNKYGLAKITTEQGASVVGLVLLPDSWILPDGCNWTAGCGTGWTTNSYTAIQWAKMEQAGAVFLPAAGWRDGSTVGDVGTRGRWWSSTPYSDSGDYAHDLYFYSGNVDMGDRTRYYGGGVRLVALVKN